MPTCNEDRKIEAEINLIEKQKELLIEEIKQQKINTQRMAMEFELKFREIYGSKFNEELTGFFKKINVKEEN